jgi:hypothetical protein
VVPRDFLDHTDNGQCIAQQQDTERRLHVCEIDINVRVDDIKDILFFLPI